MSEIINHKDPSEKKPEGLLEGKYNRKEFLKIAGLGALLGAGGPGAVNLFANMAATSQESETTGVQKRWGLVIDTTKCKEGCTKCSDVCHSAHNVPDYKDPKIEIKWIWKEHAKNLFPDLDYALNPSPQADQEMVALCNHCKNPPCVRVCPTQATFKRAEDGIVMMDYHRCIGCRFCMAGCPYGSRSFNFKDPRPALDKVDPAYPTRTTGVVEKCNFCAEILGTQEEGKQTTRCAGACPEGAILFGDLNDPESNVRQALKKDTALRRKAELGTEPSVFYIV